MRLDDLRRAASNGGKDVLDSGNGRSAVNP